MVSAFKDLCPSNGGDKAHSQVSTLQGRPSKNEAQTRWKERTTYFNAVNALGRRHHFNEA